MNHYDDLELALMGQARLLALLEQVHEERKRLWSYSPQDLPACKAVNAEIERISSYCTHRNADGGLAEPSIDDPGRSRTCPHCYNRWNS